MGVERQGLRRPFPSQARYGDQSNYDIMDVEAAWAAFPAAGDPAVVVQVVDTGLLVSHEEFQDNVWKNPGEVCGNGVDDDANGLVDDCHGYNWVAKSGTDLYNDHTHGTHCAGTIAGTRNNGKGVAGICGGDGSGTAWQRSARRNLETRLAR